MVFRIPQTSYKLKMETTKNSKFVHVKSFFSESALFLLMIALIVFFSIMSDRFFTQLNLTNILVQNVHVAVCATAAVVLMISGSTDLSIGYQVSIGAVLCTMLISKYNVNMWAAILAGVSACVACGTFNGVMAQKLKAHPMMVSLGTMAIFQGISYLISQSKTFYSLPEAYMFLGQGQIGVVPVNALIALVLILIVGFVLSSTFVGHYVYAVGDNPEAARLAGIKVGKIKLLAFVFASILVGVSAILLSARAGSADSTTGTGIEFTNITACVLGGCSIKGGSGKLWKVIVAVFVLGILSNGMQLIGLGVYPQFIAKGAIMLFSIYLGNRSKSNAFSFI